MKLTNYTPLCRPGRFVSILIFITAFVFQAYSQDPGFFLDDWTARDALIPNHESAVKSSNTAGVDVQVDAANIVNKVPQYIFGNNAVTWDDGLRLNPRAMTDLKNLNPHVLRWPGGNLSNVYFWNQPYGNVPSDVPSYVTNDHGIWYGQNCPSWQLSNDEYYSMLAATNSTGIICVNYSYARYGTSDDPVAKAAHMAAEWVRFDNGRSKFWEIGNENFGNWQSGYEIQTSYNKDGQPQYISGQLYGEHCLVFIDSMRAAAAEIDVDIKIGVNVFDAETSWDPIQTVWNEQLLPIVGDLVDFLAVHSYFTPYDENSTVSTILNSYVVPEEIMNALVSDMNEAGMPIVPVAMTEWNIFAVGSWQQVSYINGMLAAMVLGEYVKHDYGAANRWDLVNGWNNGNDHGMFSSGGEPGVDAYNPRAVFHYMNYFQRFFGDQMVNSTVSGNSSIKAYASTFSSEETGLVLVNTSRSAETAEITLSNITAGLNYYTYTLVGGTDNGDFSRKVIINGVETDEEGGGPDSYASLPAAAYETDGGIIVDLPALSVVYVMVDAEAEFQYVKSYVDTDPHQISILFSEEIQLNGDPSGFEIQRNGSELLNITNYLVDPLDPRILKLTLAEEITYLDQLVINYSGSEIQSSEGITVLAISDEEVENLLPSGPHEISILVLNSHDNQPMDNVEINISSEVQFTNEEGKAIYNLMEGDYSLDLSRLYFNSIQGHEITVTDIAEFQILMDSAEYDVQVHVYNLEDASNIQGAEVTIGSRQAITNSDGTASLTTYGDLQRLKVTATNFQDFNQEIQIDGNEDLEIGLTATHGSVKFKIYQGEQPIQNATVSLGDQNQQTNLTGTCTFESVLLNSTISYQVVKTNYFDLEGELTIVGDSTIELQMQKSVANLALLLEGPAGNALNAYAVIDSDTAYVNADQKIIFYNYPIQQNYQYLILSDNYAPYSGELFLEKDSTVTVLLTVGIDIHTSNWLRIYPVPANEKITIESEWPIQNMVIYNLQGGEIFRETYNSVHQLDHSISSLKPGVYLIRIESTGKTLNGKLIVE